MSDITYDEEAKEVKRILLSNEIIIKRHHDSFSECYLISKKDTPNKPFMDVSKSPTTGCIHVKIEDRSGSWIPMIIDSSKKQYVMELLMICRERVINPLNERRQANLAILKAQNIK